MRNLLILLVLLLWLALGWKMCTDYTACCGEEVAAAAPPPSDAAPPAASIETIKCPDIVCFSTNSCEPIFGERWSSYRDSMIGTVSDGQTMVISGYYATNESNNSAFENLGLCRADAIKKAFLDVNGDLSTDVIGQLRVGLRSQEGELLTDNFSIQIQDGKSDELEDIQMSTLIYFPFNSTNKLSDASVESYLRQVASRVKSSGERVRLTGHTDNIGSTSYNMNLGRNRATIIRDYLVAQGVPRAKIIVDSKGESQPVATNETDDGRAKNRRTELEIIK